MLMLSRKEGQRVRIGHAIEVAVVEVRGRTVRLGIVAPGAPVYREEVYQAIASANAEAAAGGPALPQEEDDHEG